MTTNARTWFYEEPEHNGYALVERLNSTLWGARVGQVIMAQCLSAEPPFRVRGFWRDTPIELEWVPKQWLALRGSIDLRELVQQLSHVLGFKPAFRYDDGEDCHVYEWHRDEAQGHERWQAIQGKPLYKHPERFAA